jgi:hypothetical protein
LYGGTFRRQILAAKALCGRCGLKASCLAGALAREEQFGIWGGTTPEERAQLLARRRARRVVSLPHARPSPQEATGRADVASTGEAPLPPSR